MEGNREDYPSKYLNGDKFADGLHELREYTSFSYAVLSVEHKWAEYLHSIENLRTATQEFILTLSRLFGLVDLVGSESGAQRFLRDTGEKSFFLGRGTVFCPPNSMIAFQDKSQFPEKLRSMGVLDYSEWGTRWGVSWAMLLGVMLCFLAETFLLHNADIEVHVETGGSASELHELTKRAFRDFATYYDVDVIQSEPYRFEFELAKKAFGINNYHRIFQERLDLFAEYEATEASARISRRLWYLTIVLTAATIVLGAITLLLRFA